MLVLSRQPGEEVVIDHDIRISVVAANRREVRLGVVAPPSLHVLRQEQGTPTSKIPLNSNASESSIMAGVIRLAR